MERLKMEEFSEMATWKWWEIPGFIQGWGTKGESKISSFFSDVNQRNEGAGSVQDFLAWLQGWKDCP